MDKKLLNGYNLDINEQIKVLEKIVMKSKNINTVIERAESLNLENYYIGAGCIAQTVWNYLSDKPLDYGIKDIDFVYFDEKNLDEESENKVISYVKELYSDLDIEVDVKNEARVHLWYKDHFGYDIKPYTSLEDDINSWPTTSTAVGIRRDKNGAFKIYAPFGLNDLFGKIVRANKAQITKDIYENKTTRWLSKWPDLKVIPWEK
ncbi:nucleotidyltransferase family protein [Inconstantimicrobium porci]|uniref:nucleotidyltransferase family protein n=1 Tax=Inconstantimicrobium porci TaxID=2652291 RepID=UPI00240A6090|nr:nucleotidyltransferase family protein [Inconstantimicrobium porci]MDD6771367.1 nucleotidyltransferase family protein [Inconstantimicrobium porci]